MPRTTQRATTARPIALGRGAQVVLMDLSHAGEKNIKPDDPLRAQFIATHDALARYARNATFTFATDHYSILGVTIPDGQPDKPPEAVTRPSGRRSVGRQQTRPCGR